MQPVSDQELFDAIKSLAIVDVTVLEQVFTEAQATHHSLSDALIARDLVSDENIGRTIADIISVPFIRLATTQIDVALLKTLPEIVAKKHQMIVFGHDAQGLKVAMTNPKEPDVAAFLSKKTGEQVKVYYATPKDIETALHFYKKDLQTSFDDLIAHELAIANKGTVEKPIAKLFDLLVEYAYDNKTSDIHIEPQAESSAVRFRIDGVLHDVLTLPKNLHDQLLTRIKILAQLRTDEHLSAQDGKLQRKLPAEDLDVRVSIVPIVEGEKAVLRLLSSKSRQFSLADLGMEAADLEKVTVSYQKPYGMVLVTGPTGSGKTTTIYAILKILNTREKNIATIEDPVEYEIAGINQIQVNPKTNLTFASGLRSILRQDPNIIFVGEIRDRETADIAVNAAMTGHLVLSTLHTNDAVTTLPRLIDLGVEPFLVASTVNVVIAQRLVRQICIKCRVSKIIPPQEIKLLFPDTIMTQYFPSEEVRVYEGQGCSICHQTGYIGRIALFEVLVIDKTLKSYIAQKRDAQDLFEQARAFGMTTMLEDGIQKIKAGITTVEEVMRATKS